MITRPTPTELNSTLLLPLRTYSSTHVINHLQHHSVDDDIAHVLSQFHRGGYGRCLGGAGHQLRAVEANLGA